MNKKIEKFDAFLAANNVTNWFTKEEHQDEVKSVVYRGFFDIGEVKVPVFIVLDDTVFNLGRIIITTAPVPEDRRDEVITYLNDLNSRFKIFKYYLSNEDGFVYMDVSFPGADEFEPALLMSLLLEVVEPHLKEFYSQIIDTVLGTNETKKTRKGKTSLRVKKETTARN